MTDLKIIITGENKASPKLREVKKDLDNLNSGSVDAKKNFQNLNAVGLESLQNSLQVAEGAILGLGAGAVAATGTFITMGIQSASSFEKQLSAIKALTGSTKEEMKQIEKLSFDLGAQTSFSALEAAQGAEELLKAGVSLSAVLDGALAGSLDLAAAGSLSVADAAEIASTALNAFRKDGLSVARVADILAGAANASATDVSDLKFGLSSVASVAAGVGLTFEDTSKALAIFAQNGLKGSDAGTSLKSMLLNLQPTTKGQRELFDELGLTIYGTNNAFFDAQGKIKPLADIAGVLKKALKDLTDQQRLQALETLFGTDAIRAGNIFYAEGAKGVNAMADAINKVSAKDVASEKINNFAGSVERMMGSFETKSIEIFQQALPVLAGYISQIEQAINNVDVQSLIDGFTIFSQWLKENEPLLKNLAITIGIFLTGGLISLITQLAIAAAPFAVVLGFVTLFNSNLPIFAGALTTLGLTIWAFVVPALWAKATAMWAVAAAFVAANAPIIAMIAVLALLVAAIVWVYQNWDSILKLLNEIVTLVVFTMIEQWEGLIYFIKTIIDFLVKNVFSFLITGLLSLIFPLYALYQAFDTNLFGIKAIVTNVFNSIDQFLSQFSLYNTGKNIMWGLINGVTSMYSQVKNSIVGAMEGAVNSAKSFLGIKSPSRLFQDDIAFNVIKGFTLGIEKNTPDVEKTMTNLSATTTTPMNAGISNNSSSISNNSSSATANITINVQKDNQGGSEQSDQEIYNWLIRIKNLARKAGYVTN